MAKVTLKGNPLNINGNFPQIGSKIDNFTLTANDLSEVNLKDLAQKTIVLNIFPSLDTPTCSLSVVKFNQSAGNIPDCAVLCISKDLPFAQARFCGAHEIKNVTTLSAFRNPDFARNLGVDIADGPIRGLLARSVIVLNDKREVIYTELVPEITQEPDYEKCLSAIAKV
jgi:thiol peroxidase